MGSSKSKCEKVTKICWQKNPFDSSFVVWIYISKLEIIREETVRYEERLKWKLTRPRTLKFLKFLIRMGFFWEKYIFLGSFHHFPGFCGWIIISSNMTCLWFLLFSWWKVCRIHKFRLPLRNPPIRWLNKNSFIFQEFPTCRDSLDHDFSIRVDVFISAVGFPSISWTYGA